MNIASLLNLLEKKLRLILKCMEFANNNMVLTNLEEKMLYDMV